MASVKESWTRIEAWLQVHAETIAGNLPGPTPEDQIAACESEIGMSLPGDLRESYLVQNGVEYGEEELNLFPTPPDCFDEMAFCLLPVEAVAGEWKIWKELIDGDEFEDVESEPAPEINSDWWSDGWIPVAGNGAGDFLCVDMKPSPKGTVGQVICAWHDMEERTLVAASWSDYLSGLADEMESGGLSYAEDEGIIRNLVD
jgi:cell wall assembly regulator SMI1